MPITRPTSEQVLIKSANTGDSTLDSYIEAMELNGEAAYDLLAKVIDPTDGNPFPVNVELRTNAGFIEAQVTAHGTTGAYTPTPIPDPEANPPTIEARDNGGTLEIRSSTATTTGAWTATTIGVSAIFSPNDLGTPLGGHAIVQLARDTAANNDAYTGSAGEITVDTTNNTARVHDGSTAGGHALRKESDTIPVSNGGTGATDAATARSNLGVLASLVEDATPQLGGNLDAQGNKIQNALLQDTAEEVVAHGSVSSGTEDFDMSAANVHTITAGGNFTATFSNPVASGDACYLVIEITNGGAHTITWPGSVVWDAGVAPTLQTSGVDILVFVTRDGGTTWRGVRGWKAA